VSDNLEHRIFVSRQILSNCIHAAKMYFSGRKIQAYMDVLAAFL